jgi:hypothetical protein
LDNKYKQWLVQQGYAENTQVAQLHRVQKVEQSYGSLDDLLNNGAFDKMISSLTYSVGDERENRPNPSQLKFDGNIRNYLQSYKNAATRYRRFWEKSSDPATERLDGIDEVNSYSDRPLEKQRFAFEHDMQSALRRDISNLEPGLTIVDGGAEHSVASGFIDVLCEDKDGARVVVELKAGTTDSRVIAQTLGYMGDVLKDEPDCQVRGIIAAHDFDSRTRSAAIAVSNIDLVSYSAAFHFRREE